MALEQGARAALKRKKEQGQEGLLWAVNDRHCLLAQDLDSSLPAFLPSVSRTPLSPYRQQAGSSLA